jgi:hypothetical protein
MEVYVDRESLDARRWLERVVFAKTRPSVFSVELDLRKILRSPEF